MASARTHRFAAGGRGASGTSRHLPAPWMPPSSASDHDGRRADKAAPRQMASDLDNGSDVRNTRVEGSARLRAMMHSQEEHDGADDGLTLDQLAEHISRVSNLPVRLAPSMFEGAPSRLIDRTAFDHLLKSNGNLARNVAPVELDALPSGEACLNEDYYNEDGTEVELDVRVDDSGNVSVSRVGEHAGERAREQVLRKREEEAAEAEAEDLALIGHYGRAVSVESAALCSTARAWVEWD
jgi:hypothetical protein